MRIVFELKRGEQAEVILNNLYKQHAASDQLRHHQSFDRQRPAARAGADQTIKYFIEHRVDVVRRRTDYELRKAREREHILLGFRWRSTISMK